MAMNWHLGLSSLLLVICIIHVVYGHLEFTTKGCLAAHNKLRALHLNTNDVTYDNELEKSAKEVAELLQFGDNTIDSRPSRPLPKRRRRKRRHTDEDVDGSVHVESWSGDIYYPDSGFPKSGDYGQSIHKFCCRSRPHCPKEFFHQLAFPPSAEGVIDDFYNEEIGSYDFTAGKKKAQHYTRIKHFSNIVWKKTTKIGCAQSQISNNNCVYTVVQYKVEGSLGGPEVFKENIGDLKAAESDDSNILTIFLIVFFVVLLISLVVLCYCCRDNLRSRQTDLRIKIDTMKAEQELETDSTSLWWTRAFKKKRPLANRPSRARSTKQHQTLKERPSIEVMLNTAPQRSIRMPPRVRGESNAQSFAIKYQGISQKARHYVPGETIYENTTNALGYDNAAGTYENNAFKQKPLPISPLTEQPRHPNLEREPSLSGKPAPPPVPTNPVPTARQNPMFPKLPGQQPPTWQKPQSVAVSRGPSNAATSNNKPTASAKPLLPPAPTATPPLLNKPQPQPRPVPAVRRTPTDGGEASPTVNELRNQFNRQHSSPSTARKTPPVKPKPMLPPGARPR